MMQHAGGDHVFERLTEFGGPLDGKLTYFEIVEHVFLFQLLRERDARGADVDPDDARAWPAHCIVRGLHRATAGNKNAAVVTILLAGPEEMRFGAAAPAVPAPPVSVQVVHRRRVRMALV